MIVFLNGQFVAEEHAVVSAFDRGFLYGDGLFEAMRVERALPTQWARHMARLKQGCEMLRLRLPFAPDELHAFAIRLVDQNKMRQALLRLLLSRGVGPRGYSCKGADSPTVVMSLHPAPILDATNPPCWKLITSSIVVRANDPLATVKTCNKLAQILARSEAEMRGADEAVMLNTDGEIAETAGGNLFWIEHDTVCTTPLAAGILAGVTRATILDLCRELGLKTCEKRIRPQEFRKAQGLFVSLNTMGVVAASELDGIPLPRSPLVAPLQAAWMKLIEKE